VRGDYLEYAGKLYLVVVDRYSGWPVMVKCTKEMATELIRVLRGYFCAYKATEELASG
jgi:hypothetical protein